MKRISLISIILALALAADATAAGPVRIPGDGDETRTRWGILRLQGIFILPLGENHIEAWNDCEDSWFDFLNFSSVINTNATGGILASFEYVLARRYGIELAFAYWHRILDLSLETDEFTAEGSPNFIMPTIGFNYHILTDEQKDIYAGALCCLGVLATGVGGDMDISKDVALGLNLGMDYYVKGSWSVGGTIKYIDFGEMNFSLLPSGIEGILCNNGLFGMGRMNTISVTCGIGYRF